MILALIAFTHLFELSLSNNAKDKLSESQLTELIC
jgi:hypothetical protein